MRRTVLMTAALLLLSIGGAEACGRKKMHCGCHPRRGMAQQPVAYAAPVYYTPAITPPTSATPQMTAMPAPTLAYQAPAAVESAPAGIQPTYNYDPAAGGQQAYYYTYDNSGKLVVSQWMDWLFRGGRVAGMPAPPLPIIGALRNR